MENKIEDLEKIKIEILRDAVKDVSDTIRALDKKTQFLVSYNAIFLGLIGTIFLRFDNIKAIIVYEIPFLLILGILACIWIFVFIKLMKNISPIQIPLNSFCTNKDRDFATNAFFVLVKNDFCHRLERLVDDYDFAIQDERSAKKLLYKEIVKLSFMRDSRIKVIQKSIINSSRLTATFMFIIVIFVLANYLKEVF